MRSDTCGLELARMKCPLPTHPQRQFLRLQLMRNPLLAVLDEAQLAPLAGQVMVQEAHRGECLLAQGSRELRQFFVLEGLVKRIVCSPQGREMTVRFAGEGDFETCYDAWRRHDVAAYSVVCAARCCVASVSMQEWCTFMAQHASARQVFHERIAALGESLVEHAVGLLLLDAPSRVNAFSRQHPSLVGRLMQKDLASHLNLSAETLCRLSRRAEGRSPLRADLRVSEAAP
jgi:CRP-like cAMP-binding protein